MLKCMPPENRAIINKSQAVLDNFAEFLEDLFVLSGTLKQSNDSLFWFNSGLPHGMYNFAFADNKAKEEDLKQSLQDLDRTSAPFFFVNGFSLEDSHDAMFADLDVDSFGRLDGMYFDLSWETPNTQVNGDCHIQIVSNPEEYKLFAEVMAEAAGLSPDVGPKFYSNYQKYEESPFLALLATLNGRPVGCSFVFMPEGGVAGNYVDWVLLDSRKRGINSAMVAKRLQLAKEAGYQYLIVQCMDTSTRLYSKLGFEKVCELDLYGRN